MSLRIVAILLMSGILALAVPQTLRAQDNQAFSAKQQDAINKLVHDYIMSHPEVISDAIDALREKEQLAAEAAAKKALADRKTEVFNSPDSPSFGNPKGDISVVEFFDYRCPYCKGMLDSIFSAVKADGKIRLVMKELPVLGPDSVVAARAAIASRAQNRYEEFHRALMHVNGPLTEAEIMKTAGSVGLDTTRLKKDMDADQVDKIINSDIELARALNVQGTPGFVIGDQLYTGAMSIDSFKQLIAQARKAKS